MATRTGNVGVDFNYVLQQLS